MNDSRREMGGILGGEKLQDLLDILVGNGYRVIGPRVRNSAIVYDEVRSVAELPQGYKDSQEPGEYRLSHSDSSRYFDHVVGPQSWKQFLYPSRRKIWESDRANGSWEPVAPQDDYVPTAFFGVRDCEIAAIRVLDRVLRDDSYQDPVYVSRRDASLVVAVDCARPASTCFCTSMGGGPAPRADFDISLSEIGAGDSHRFVVRPGSNRGDELLSQMDLLPPSESDLEAVSNQLVASKDRLSGGPEMADARDVLAGAWSSERWNEVAERCLSCANCTMACPTCFCSDVEDVTSLAGDHAERWQKWDSCFTLSHSLIHGGSVRKATASRYRQWMMHKLSTWHDQFGSSGCVGCGRCITWCPVGIDIREELSAIRKENLISSVEETS